MIFIFRDLIQKLFKISFIVKLNVLRYKISIRNLKDKLVVKLISNIVVI